MRRTDMSSDEIRSWLASLSLPAHDAQALPSSPLRFPDGAAYRIEIPSVEGPAAFEAVLEAAAEHDVSLQRISQGSGVMLLTDAELATMAKLGADNGVEVVLWSGLRAGWDTGAQARATSGSVAQSSLRGTETLVAGLDEAVRAAEAGIDGVLVADVGQLMVLGQMKRAGLLPTEFVLKVSISLPVTNPATAVVMANLGATTLNLPVDLSLAAIAGIRAAVELPLDIYIEAADDFGGTLRYHELPELVRVAAPVHLKFTMRNAPGLYPAGGHLQAAALATARERVRRAAIGLEVLRRHPPGDQGRS